jgi:hypothetical protein
MARIAGRVFPSARTFAESVRAENLDQDDYFTNAPNDTIHRLSSSVAIYTTPGHANGLGTMNGAIQDSEPIRGLILMTLGSQTVAPYLTKLDVQLSAAEAHLYASIAIAKLASAYPAGEAASESEGKSADRIGTVTAFYEALGRADGAAAAAQLVPEKRIQGAFSAAEITKFYSGLSEPLKLLSTSTKNDGLVRVQYRYRLARGTVCDGEALVALRPAGDNWLIETIKALNKC